MENKVHVWIGTNFSSDDEYMTYFELDCSVEGDFNNPNYKLCGFCRDVGVQWYDSDFIGIIPRHEQEVSLDEILLEAAIDQSELYLVKRECASLGIKKANAIFWYQDPSLVVKQSIKYNGLQYIGLFDGD